MLRLKLIHVSERNPQWHIYASVNYATRGSDDGLLPVRHRAIIWANDSLLLIALLGTNFREVPVKIQPFHSRKCIWKCGLKMVATFSRSQYLVELVSCGQQYRKSVWAAKLFSSVTEQGHVSIHTNDLVIWFVEQYLFWKVKGANSIAREKLWYYQSIHS